MEKNHGDYILLTLHQASLSRLLRVYFKIPIARMLIYFSSIFYYRYINNIRNYRKVLKYFAKNQFRTQSATKERGI